MVLVTTWLVGLSAVAEATETSAQTTPDDALTVPRKMRCTAWHTVGLHDYPHNEEAYEPVAFNESRFKLSVNRVLMRHLAPDAAADVYLILENDGELSELSCVKLRGYDDSRGLSCSNSPPSEFLLLNTDTLRFTHTSIGGWTFAAANENTAGDSIYVEYGVCEAN